MRWSGRFEVAARALDVGVHVDISWSEVRLDELLILLQVAPG